MANSASSSPPSLGRHVIDQLARLVPRRFRTDVPVVPVVRMIGAIGIVTPLRPGLLLSTIARSLERAFEMTGASRGACHQFAWRFALAIAPDFPAYPPARGGKANSGPG